MNDGGDCFVVAGHYVLEHPNTILVHGIVEGQGQLTGVLFSHAWVESGSTVIDKSNGNNIKMERKLYYHFGKIQEKYLKKYSHKQATEYMLKEAHWGPWDKVLFSWKIKRK